jgi:tryptophan halogenase
MSDVELSQFLKGITDKVDHLVSQLPSHQSFISKYCPAESA